MNLMRNNTWIRQRFVALFACASVLLSALAPTISHAMANDDVPPGMMKVCTSAGTKFIPLNFIIAKTAIKTTQSLPSTRSSKLDSMAACSYCDQHAGTHSILTQTDYQFNTPDLSNQYAVLFYLHPRSYFHTTPPSPRAPPSHLS